MKSVNWKKWILPNIPYVFIALLATKLGLAWRLAPGFNFSGKLLHLMEGMAAAFDTITPSFHPVDFCVGIAVAAAIRLAVYVKGKNAKKFSKNTEYGSARWGTADDIRPFIDPVFENNILLTQTERLMIDELSVLDGGKCILQLRGVRPFCSDKFDITRHKQYRYLSDYDERNLFSIEKYLSTQLKPTPTEEYDLYEVDASEAETTA